MINTKNRLVILLASILLMAAVVAGSSAQSKAQVVALNGAGASFPYPLYSKWLEEYRKTHPSVAIDYQSIGSGGGIKGIINQTLDFAGSDAPMNDEQMAKAPGTLFHIPTVMGAVVVTYNLKGVGTGFKLTPDVLADIFLGKIKMWNDKRITSINPGVKLPAQAIIVAHRSDGSGTTNIFTDYLSSVSGAWKAKVGKGTSVEWPAGIGAKGNEGVSGAVKQTPGAIGYVELAYAVQNKLPYAFLKNQSGQFVKPTLDSTTAAAAGAAANMSEDMRVSIVDAPGKNAYPIAGYTYLLVYQAQQGQAKGTELVNFLWWAIHDGQKFADDLLYAPLPKSVVKLAENKIRQIKYQGNSLYK